MGKVLKCSQCSLSAHAGRLKVMYKRTIYLLNFSVSCGAQLPEGASPDDWLCDLCQNEKTMDASLVSITLPLLGATCLMGVD